MSEGFKEWLKEVREQYGNSNCYDMIKFFKNFKGRYQIRSSEIKRFYFEYHNFETTNPNQYYLFINQLNCFLDTGTHKKTKSINWDLVNKKLLNKKNKEAVE